MVKVSCVIPALNEENNILKLITSIRRQKGTGESFAIEIIVVDNGSTDRTVEVAASAGATVLSFPELTIGGLRNEGAHRASGDVLLFLDADNILTEEVVASLVEKINRENVGAICVHLRPCEPHSWVVKGWYAHLKPKKIGFYKGRTLASGAFMIKKAIFHRVGGFNAKLKIGEDTDLSRRISSQNLKVFFDSEVLIFNSGFTQGLLQFCKKEFWRGDSIITLAIHNNIDALTCFLFLIVISFITFLTAAFYFESYLYLLVPVVIVVIPSIYKAFKKTDSLDVNFFRLTIIYFAYLLSRSSALFKV